MQSPRLTDVAVATATAVLAIAGLLLLPVLQAAEPTESIESPTTAGWWLTVAAIVAQAIALLWAALSPRVVLVVVAGLPVVLAIAAPSSILSLTTLAITVAVFLAVVRVPLRSLSITLPIAAVLVAISQFVNEAGRSLDAATLGIAALQAVVVVGVPLVIGLYFAARKDARVSRGNEIVALKRERDALVQAAVSRERIAMSRELHDIAAHHMSGIALLASAIYRQVDLDPEAAKIAAQQVRAQSTTVLDDLRRVIGLLRDEAESTRTVETLAAIPELVELRRATGAEVELVVHATDHELGTGVGPLAQLVAYRMVQESLANASTHAPGACTAALARDSCTIR